MLFVPHYCLVPFCTCLGYENSAVAPSKIQNRLGSVKSLEQNSFAMVPGKSSFRSFPYDRMNRFYMFLADWHDLNNYTETKVNLTPRGSFEQTIYQERKKQSSY